MQQINRRLGRPANVFVSWLVILLLNTTILQLISGNQLERDIRSLLQNKKNPVDADGKSRIQSILETLAVAPPRYIEDITNRIASQQDIRTLPTSHFNKGISRKLQTRGVTRKVNEVLMTVSKLDQQRGIEHMHGSYGGKGGKGSSKSGGKGGKGGKGGGKGGKGGGKGGKGQKRGKGKGKGKGGSKGSKSGKGGKGSKGSKGKGSEPVSICDKLDFHEYYYDKIFGSHHMSKSGKGGSHRSRQLQFGGEQCTGNVLDVAMDNPDFSIFVDAVKLAGLEEIFTCAGPFTVLAPTNDAFRENPALLEYLLANPDKLQQVLLYHIIPGYFPSDEFVTGPVDTLFGKPIQVHLDPLTFNQAGVEIPNVEGCNGIVHGLDDVLIPPESGILPDICNVLDFRRSGQFPNQTPITPTSPIMNRTYSSMLNRSGRRLQFDGEMCNPNMYDVILDNPDTESFGALIEAAGLTEIFLCAGPFTVLAPSNDAIEAIGQETLDELLLPENLERLQELLLYHIVPGYEPSTALVSGPLETLLEGESVDVTLDPAAFNDAEVIDPDNEGCNGIMHVIDDVLTPGPVASPTETPISAPTTAPTVSDICANFTFVSDNGGSNQCASGGDNMLETARGNPDLSQLVELFDLAGFADVFDCPGLFTGFFPTNDAFEALNPDILTFLTDPENLDALQGLLLYHLLGGENLVTDLRDKAGEVPTLLDGEPVFIALSGADSVTVNGGNITDPNIDTCNGIIQIVDQVLIPLPDSDAPSVAPAVPDSPTVAPFADTVEPTESPIVGTMAPTESLAPVVATSAPTASREPTTTPRIDTDSPTIAPTVADTLDPTVADTLDPTVAATLEPTVAPTAAATGAISDAPSASPGDQPRVVTVQRFYIAYANIGLPEPTAAQYNSVLNQTTIYLEKRFNAFFTDSRPDVLFLGINASIESTDFENPPDDISSNYNVLVNYDLSDFLFEPTSTIPTTAELFSLMKEFFDDNTYILEHVLEADGFENTNSIIFDARETTMPAPAP